VATGPAAPDIVTLIVTPQDALTINWAMKSGVDLVLTLRGPKDDTTTETTSVTLNYLVDNYNITVPSKLPYGLEPRLTTPINPVLPNDRRCRPSPGRPDDLERSRRWLLSPHPRPDVDDIAETREHQEALQFEADIEVVGGARSGQEGIQMAAEARPDVVLMDINMPDMDGITATEGVIEQVPFCQVVILSVQSEPDYMRRAMMAGAKDFIPKPPSGDELIKTIRFLGERAEG
jgi:CheY-like chemotaxis protein